MKRLARELFPAGGPGLGVRVMAALVLFAAGFFCGQRWNAPEPAPVAEQASAQAVAAPERAALPGQPPPEPVLAESPSNDLPGAPGTAQGDLPEADRALPAPEPALQASAASPSPAPVAPRESAPEPAGSISGASAPGTSAPGVSAQDAARPFATASQPFILHKLGTGKGPTLLVVGGIQGDEPGGFSAAALLASHYTIHSGSVWVVPNLNFPSILKRHRGIFGDMNRKFAALDPSDPEYETIRRIKSVLLDDEVSLVLNLHDGSGFYRPTWEDALRNPKRWGQSVIIDQKEMDAPSFNLLHETAGLVESEVNRALLDPVHRYHTHNTDTASGNVEMSKTLSWFAVCNGKPAFGVEASKEFGTEYRSYYHLQVVEAFMRRMGIEFERDFSLTPKGVLQALNTGLSLSAFDDRLVLHLDNVRPTLNLVPFKKNASPEMRATKPLLALVQDEAGKDWRVAYGNRTLCRVNPVFMDFDYSLHSLDLEVDGESLTVPLGSLISVKQSFLVRHAQGYRVNAIGAQKERNGTEADVLFEHKDFMPRFSVDKDARVYRVELYKGKAFAGMVLVRFGGEGPPLREPLTATGGRESALGF